MYSISVGVTRIPKLRNLFPGAVRAMEARTNEAVRPRVETDVTELLAPYPGPVVYPFQFATIKSQRFYFANFQPPYQRTNALKEAWYVNVVSTLNNSPLAILGALFRQQTINGQITIVIGNSAAEARYVYPPKPVPGHVNTGWNLDKGAEIVARAREYVFEEWPVALSEAIAEN